MARRQAVLLHPLTSLEWMKCAEAPFGIRDAQAVCLSGKLYIGGGDTLSDATDSAILCYNPIMNSWKIIESPTRLSALTTYQDKLVLVGGIDDSGHATGKLWSLQDDDSWVADELPRMPTPRLGSSAVNIGSHLIVAGGGSNKQQSQLSVVEVFDGRRWTSTESLPKACRNMKSTLHNGEWYLMGGEGQGKAVFCVTVDSLIATAGFSAGRGSVWKTLPEAPLTCIWSSIVVYGNQLLAIGGRVIHVINSAWIKQSAVYGYVAGTQSWVHVEDLPEPIDSTCSIVLPSRELVVVGGQSDKGLSSSIFKAIFRVNPFQLDSRLSVAALSRLQYAANIQLLKSIAGVWELFVQSLTMDVVSVRTQLPFITGSEVVGKEVVKQWLIHECGKPPTWRSLVEVLASLPQLAPLAETINHRFVFPLLENRIGNVKHHLNHHDERILREKAVVREKEKFLKLDYLLHPLTSLEWRKCAQTPYWVHNAHAVYLSDRVCIGGEDTPKNSTILCYDPEIDLWKSIKSPTRMSALTTYHSKLVLVGGRDDTGHTTNKLWSLQDNDRWTDELPPMPTSRYGASAVNTGSNLIVAGGVQQGCDLNVVEVFNARWWTITESLPQACWCMKSTLDNGKWYLMGGYSQGKSVFCATVDSLIATAGSGEGEGGSVWKTLPEAPLVYSSIATYGNLLLAIGGYGGSQEPQSAIYGYITGTRSWVHVGDLPVPVSSWGSPCSIILPSGELLVVGRTSVFRTKLKFKVINLQQLCVMTIIGNNIDYLQLPQHLQKVVERYS